MDKNNQHYYSQFPDANVKIYTISESLRKHLYIFKTISGVFSYNKIDLGTKVFIDHMVIPKEASTLLDLGCGYGPIGIVLSYESPESTIYLIDINKRAIWCAKENIKINLLNYKKKVKVLAGNYFAPINNKYLKFDSIYMNPSLRQGLKNLKELIKEISTYLKPNGSFQFVIKKKMGASYISEFLKKIFTRENVNILCKRSGYWVFRCFNE